MTFEEMKNLAIGAGVDRGIQVGGPSRIPPKGFTITIGRFSDDKDGFPSMEYAILFGVSKFNAYGRVVEALTGTGRASQLRWFPA